ncbi:uncharacterized protein LOC141619249 [Silene latifolia]|uniref:uncharacterized protein LOC141619249 n=1 Tax=Silene latifolia TaxID=37657 RepID=UPI003D77E9B6
MFTETAKEIWETLQRRYTVANGARKFKLNKESYEINQDKRSIEEYYTQLQIVWDELENMNNYPVVTKISAEMKVYFEAVEKQAEERRLFQFLNGLDKDYATLRSNILLMSPLPTVDAAVSIFLQEESQTNNVSGGNNQEASALMGKGEKEEKPEDACKHCRRSNHKSEKCWEVLGYPKGHPKHKQNNARFAPNDQGYGNDRVTRNYQRNSNYPQANRFSNNFKKNQGNKKHAANAKQDQGELASAINAVTQQLENLLKMVPGSSGSSKTGGDTDDELECNYAGLF